MNYYNENDPFAAAWLRELIKANQIAPGEVDERSIEDVFPNDLRGYKQCHFFAGIGGWSYALRLAGWPDDYPVWTGSCPCQPFSSAGKRKGTSDERHLWPSWFHLISECKPVTVFGEQVEAAIRQGWLDLVQTDLEGIGYTIGAVVFPACGLGAPHIRQRLYFVAHPRQDERGSSDECGRNTLGQDTSERTEETTNDKRRRKNGDVADSANLRCLERRNSTPTSIQGECAERTGEHTGPEQSGELSRGLERLCSASNVADTKQHECGQERSNVGRSGSPAEGLEQRSSDGGVVNGFWGNAEWIYCRDEKYRAVEPGTFPLAHGAANRVGKLRGYGNAIVPQVAQAFIEAYLGR